MHQHLANSGDGEKASMAKLFEQGKDGLYPRSYYLFTFLFPNITYTAFTSGSPKDIVIA